MCISQTCRSLRGVVHVMPAVQLSTRCAQDCTTHKFWLLASGCVHIHLAIGLREDVLEAVHKQHWLELAKCTPARSVSHMVPVHARTDTERSRTLNAAAMLVIGPLSELARAVCRLLVCTAAGRPWSIQSESVRKDKASKSKWTMRVRHMHWHSCSATRSPSALPINYQLFKVRH